MISIYLVLFFLLSFLYDMLHVQEHASKTALYLLHLWVVELISGSFSKNYGESISLGQKSISAVAWVRLCNVIKAAGAQLSDDWRGERERERERQEQQRPHHSHSWMMPDRGGLGRRGQTERKGNKPLFLKKRICWFINTVMLES